MAHPYDPNAAPPFWSTPPEMVEKIRDAEIAMAVGRERARILNWLRSVHGIMAFANSPESSKRIAEVLERHFRNPEDL